MAKKTPKQSKAKKTAPTARKKPSPQVKQQMKRFAKKKPVRAKRPTNRGGQPASEDDTSSNDMASTTTAPAQSAASSETTTLTSPTADPTTETTTEPPTTIDFRKPNPFGIVATGELTDSVETQAGDVLDDIEQQKIRQELDIDDEDMATDERVEYIEQLEKHDAETAAHQPGNILNIDTAGDDDKPF